MSKTYDIWLQLPDGRQLRRSNHVYPVYKHRPRKFQSTRHEDSYIHMLLALEAQGIRVSIQKQYFAY